MDSFLAAEQAAGMTRRLGRRPALGALGMLSFLGAALTVGCVATRNDGPALPRYAYRSENIRLSYLYAVTNGPVLDALPCYCNCVTLGHGSLRDCFVRADGEFDSHAAGCDTCVDEALDAKRLHSAGQPLAEIRRYIDATYGERGKPTKTAPPAV
jgi:hypothetical protein